MFILAPNEQEEVEEGLDLLKDDDKAISCVEEPLTSGDNNTVVEGEGVVGNTSIL